MKGQSGNPKGRPKGLDFRALVERECEKQLGVTVDEAMMRVFAALMQRATSGDVPAAKLLLDKLCIVDPLELNLNDKKLTDTERAARIRAILALGEARARGDLTDDDVEDLLS